MMKMISALSLMTITLTMFLMGPTLSFAAPASSTSISFLAGSNFNERFNREKSQVLRFKHFSGHPKYGDLFFYFDVTQPTQNITKINGRLNPRLSLAKGFLNKDPSATLLRDVTLSLGLDVAQNQRAYLYGFGVDFNIPYFSHLILSAFLRDDMQVKDERTGQLSLSWVLPFEVSVTRMKFQGYLDWVGRERNRTFNKRANTKFVPEILLDVGHYWNNSDTYYVGFEYLMWRNREGVYHANESVPQLVLQAVF